MLKTRSLSWPSRVDMIWATMFSLFPQLHIFNIEASSSRSFQVFLDQLLLVDPGTSSSTLLLSTLLRPFFQCNHLSWCLPGCFNICPHFSNLFLQLLRVLSHSTTHEFTQPANTRVVPPSSTSSNYLHDSSSSFPNHHPWWVTRHSCQQTIKHTTNQTMILIVLSNSQFLNNFHF